MQRQRRLSMESANANEAMAGSREDGHAGRRSICLAAPAMQPALAGPSLIIAPPAAPAPASGESYHHKCNCEEGYRGRRVLSVCAHLCRRRSTKGAADAVMTLCECLPGWHVLLVKSLLAKVGVERRRTHQWVRSVTTNECRALDLAIEGGRHHLITAVKSANGLDNKDDRPTPLLSGMRMRITQGMCCRKNRESAYARQAGLPK